MLYQDRLHRQTSVSSDKHDPFSNHEGFAPALLFFNAADIIAPFTSSLSLLTFSPPDRQTTQHWQH